MAVSEFQSESPVFFCSSYPFTSLQCVSFVRVVLIDMSRLPETSALKRKRPASDLSQTLADADRAVLNAIKAKGDRGIFKGDIKFETKLMENTVSKALKALMANKMIKEVVNIQNKGKKHYMAVEFEPSKEVSGGAWYVEGHLDQGLITVIKKLCTRIIGAKKVATPEDILEGVKKLNVVKFELTKQHVADVLNSMVLDNEIIEVKSLGYGEYHSIPVGTVCYRLASAAGLEKGPRIGPMASIPCGACPRISQCTPDGVISPSTCVYYTKWLGISF